MDNFKFQASVEELIRKHHLAVEELTEQQLAKVLAQMLASGDIMRYVRVGDFAQCLSYVPYREVERLRGQIQKLKQLLQEHGIEEPNVYE